MSDKLARLIGNPVSLERPQTADEARDFWLLWQQAKKVFKRMNEQADAVLQEFIEDNGAFDVGDPEEGVRVSLRQSRTEKVKDLSAALLEALTRLDYDPDELVKILSASALKAGAAGKVIGPDFREKHFKVTYAQKLDDGKARRELSATPLRFLPKPKGDQE